MFDHLDKAPPDPILGLTEAFRSDSNPDKVNLSIGVYKDAEGVTPIFDTVKQAEERLLGEETTKAYLAIEGDPAYGLCTRGLLFGEGHSLVDDGRAVTADTPGGTGALRVAGEFIKMLRPDGTLWLSDPTWPNHPAIFDRSGLPTKSYPYYDKDTKALDFDAMTHCLRTVAAGDIVVLHGCCHNPSGMDPTAEQWKTLAEIAHAGGFLTVFDFAYQGLGDGLDADATGLRTFCDAGLPLLVASSYSKNFGLYRERVGALTLIAESTDAATAALSHIKQIVRAMYSNPPAHGGAIVSTILGDPKLRGAWEAEVSAMCDRIRAMRAGFVDALAAQGVERDFSFLNRQRGMFSFSGLSPEQVDRLRDEFSIYVVRSGRINVAGLTPSNMDAVSSAVATVLAD